MKSHHSVLNYAVIYECKKLVLRRINTVLPGLKYIQKNKLGIAQKTVNLLSHHKEIMDRSHLGTFMDWFLTFIKTH